MQSSGHADDGFLWYVAHTRARCEKKVADWCRPLAERVVLPVYRSVRKYRGKAVEFTKPLFPGYVFLRMTSGDRAKVVRHDQVANLLNVPDQEEFEAQVEAILQAAATDYQVRLVPTIREGVRVKVRSGPLRGLEGYVESRRGAVEVHLRLDFIGQAAAVRMDADLLELA